MAEKDKDEKKVKMNILKKLASRVQSNNDSIYKSTYYTDADNKRQLSVLKDEINTSIKNIMDNSNDNIGEPNISRLYERILMSTQNDKDTVAQFESIFGNNEFINNLTSSYLDNRWVKAIDMEIDEIIKYMPKLNEALQTLRDNILSADSFSKDYLNLNNNIDNHSSKEQFSRNIDHLKSQYGLLQMTDDIYEEISKYGEVFIYRVPYDKAIQALIDKKDYNRSINISANINESKIIIEDEHGNSSINTNNINLNFDNLNIEIDNSGIIESVVLENKETRDKKMYAKSKSLYEQYLTETPSDLTYTGNTKHLYNKTMQFDLDGKLPTHHKFDKTLDDDLPLPKEMNTPDGLKQTNIHNNPKIDDINGCIIHRLKRDRVVPIVLDDKVCLGYYYFEFNTTQNIFEDRATTTGMVNTITGLRSNGVSEQFDSEVRRDELLRNIAAQLSEKIDTKFVNNNQELKKEIYYILKYNEDFNNAMGSPNNIRVSYIPPEDMEHLYFKLDENTHRGVSDLALAFIPAKLWVAIYVTNCLAIMTRGNDKRVYYVKQSVETNISKTLLKTIDEIKKSNFGIRQLQNINNVLNITGRFNDYIIPRGNDGTSPIEFEIMQGQQIEIKTELLNLLEESAINSIGTPIELLQNRQSPEYAVQLTMTNSKFLRFAYKRQSRFEQIMAKFYTSIYNMEFGTHENISVTLPPPLFINVTNTNQLITNVLDYSTSISNIMYSDNQDELIKAKFVKNYSIYCLGSYLNMNTIRDIMNKSEQEAALEAISTPSEEEQ